MSVDSRLPELSRTGLEALGAVNGCDAEAISYSGAVQPHGVLLAVDPSSLRVVVVSDNLRAFTGAEAGAVLGEPLSAVVGADVAEQVAGLVTTRQLDDVNPIPMTLAAQPGSALPSTFEVVLHWSNGLLVLELEPLWDAAGASVSVQRSLRRLLDQPPDSFDAVQLCDSAVKSLRELTGYDRVMAYRFDADAHGEVVAEAKRPDQEAFLGLHYPAGDIPRQARLLYLKNRMRLIADVGYEPVPLRCQPAAGAAHEIDLSHCVLRSVSPVHLQYLRNMGVAATLTVSLIVNDRLWGLLACHHESPRHLSYFVRMAAETLGANLALQLRDQQRRQDHQRTKELGRFSVQVVTAMSAGEHPARAAGGVPEALLGMVGADGAVLELGGTRVVAGDVPPDDVVDRLLRDLAPLAGDAPWVTDALPALLSGSREHAGPGPAAHRLTAPDTPEGVDADAPSDPREPFDPGPDAAGALYLPLDPLSGDCVLWLRKDRAATVRWAGRPPAGDGGGGHPLSPRTSFAEWREIVRGRSRPWLAPEVRTASEFLTSMPDLRMHRAKNRLVQLALHDSLTGLANRALLLERLGEAADGSGSRRAVTAVLYVDLDQFKSVNDTLGHAAGDTLLVSAASRLRAAIRPGDTVARIGGDEFVVLLSGLQTFDEAFAVAQRIVQAFRLPFAVADEISVTATASIGVASTSVRFEPEELLRQADMALYAAKRAGRNDVAVYDLTPSELQATSARTERELRAALQNHELVVYYQPIVSAAEPWSGETGVDRWVGVEALVRWRHPDRGLLAPDHFIPVAEESGVIDEIGEYVLTESLRQLSAWGLPDLYVSVNVSARELIRGGYAAGVLFRLATAGLAPSALRLEVTETAMMAEAETAAGTLAELAAAGVGIAIDDFGTGYASLAYVRDLAAGTLKIDRSFVSGIPDNARDVALVAAAIHLAHELEMSVVAEGVETSAQLECLAGLGCDLAQGYLISRPVPGATVDAMLAATRAD